MAKKKVISFIKEWLNAVQQNFIMKTGMLYVFAV
jgi:hypothetical protein